MTVALDKHDAGQHIAPRGGLQPYPTDPNVQKVGRSPRAHLWIFTPSLPDSAPAERIRATPEPVKAFETSAQDFVCASFSMVGLLIHAAVGSLGGLGRRFPNRHGLAA
jgi:hypothetical protein